MASDTSRQRLWEEWNQLNDGLVFHDAAIQVLERAGTDAANRAIDSLRRSNVRAIVRMDRIRDKLLAVTP